MPPSAPTPHARPAPLACLECRRTHLKCDGGRPTCDRCKARGYACTYKQSARGRRRGAARLVPSCASSSINTSQTTLAEARPYTSSTATPPLPEDPLLLHSGPPPAWADDEQLVDLYYVNFHASHPILVPRHMYWDHHYPCCLKAVVHYVGGCFSQTAQRNELRQCALRQLADASQPTPSGVQAKLLYSIALFAQNAVDEGQNMLDAAIEDAVALGMHKRDFAADHARDSTILQESMRRTWYELYVIDGCMAALQRKSTFKTRTMDADVLLPCEDFIYEGGMCFVPPTLAEFHANVFEEEEKVFSSSCYRIEAVRLLGRALTITGTHGVHRDHIQAVDNSLAAFIHHLPRSKSEAEISNTFGELDELMFQAHAIIQWSIILLHYPRGDLASPNPLTQIVPGADCSKFLCPCNRQHVHSVKAVEASRTISMLAALQAPAQKHSPIFIYPLALATVVQLSVGAVHGRSLDSCMEQHSDRVKLLLGVCKTLSRHWTVAESVLRTLKKVACAVFQGSRHSTTSPLPPVSTLVERNRFDDIDFHNLYDLMGLENSTINT
ncbi:uncharacterized protein SETTUDRAFT_106973 [Exserohilum turcica Et28A]|uniref:Zn(2)-C6 fungal-type domain-containing protein n=1 Tax=Exserohilum turcicum (strain 28A) TaxID=671987 RepID=R0KHJ0_EXST2|nr:uncharacterized protein SETTUDRAFT_106973 [Exserohilum turcica Et28A]EOA88679.1 hypothetical protein SETTUDRAFT_106973 [Exserohilum turcica Et28A]